jgi:HSP20 family protein
MARDSPFEEIERFFDQFSGGLDGLEPTGGGFAVDLADHGDAFEMTADVPGYGSDDIEVTLPDPRTVRITATAETESEREASEDDYRYIRRERSERSLNRTVSLPEDVTESEASATHENGVLTVRLPKAAAEDETEIPVE